jgi:hypothetical protein
LGAFLSVTLAHIALARGGFPLLYRLVKSWPTLSHDDRIASADATELVSAMQRAVLFYVRRVECLQYAAAAVCLFRSQGIPASLVLGVHQQPFYAHAWVELNDAVLMGTVNRSQYLIIDRM